MIAQMISGAAAGVVGTIAMTAFMKPGLARLLSPRYRPDEFVPKQVVQWGQSVVGQPTGLSPRVETIVSGVAHLGYGAGAGAAYSLAVKAIRGVPSPVVGAAWGLLIWAAGYQGWMPALGVRPPTTEQPYTRWPLPIANHLLFGIVTAITLEAISRHRRQRATRIRV